MPQASLKRIHAEIEKLKAQASQIEEHEKKTAIETIKSLVAQYNITVDELNLGGKKRDTTQAKKVAKYKKGDLTWGGGRGVKPKWVREIIAKGGVESLEKYRI